MSFFKKIFGDPTAEELGQSILEYFESPEFPKELLRDPTLNHLYLTFRLKKVFADKTLTDSNWIGRADEIFTTCEEWKSNNNTSTE